MKQEYFELTRLIERLHRRLLDVLRAELVRLEIDDLNAVQALLLANIGKEEVNVRELMARGYYQGSNASYNIKKLVESGYLNQQRSPRDRRATLISLSEKGLALCEKIDELEDRQASTLAASDPVPDVKGTCQVLRQVERSWSDFVQYGD